MIRWAKRTTAGLPRIFWYLWLGTLINRMGIFVIPFLALFLTQQQDLPTEKAAFAVSMFGLGSFFAQFVGGYLADTWGRRPTMLMSLLVTPIFTLSLGFSTHFWLIVLLTLLMGFFTDLYRPASSALIADVVAPADRARAFSLRYWAINLGAAIGLSLAGWLASQNYMFLFIGDAFTTFGFGVVTLMLIPETKPQIKEPKPSLLGATRWQFFAGEGRLLQFTLLFAFLSLITASIYRQDGITMPLAMKADGFSEADYGRVIALNGIVIVLVSLGINQFMTRYSYLTAMAWNAILIGVGFGVYAFADSLWIYAGGVVLWTFGELIGSPIAPAMLADLAPSHRRAFYQGLIGASNGLAAFCGPMIGGVVYSHAGETTLWIGCFVIALGVAACYLIFMEPLYHRLKYGEANPPIAYSAAD